MITGISSKDSLLGLGLYSPAEAALYAGVKPQLLRRWLYGSSAGESVVDPQRGDEGAVSFKDFVQTLAIRAIRKEHKVSLQKIREAVKAAEDKYGIAYPLAKEHCIYLLNGRDLLINLDSGLVELTGKQKGQGVFKKIAEPFMKDLSFSNSGYASRYIAYRHRGQNIVLDPEIRFGEPILEKSGYTARTLAEACEIEGSVEEAAIAYDVSPGEVKAALNYFQHLEKLAA